MQDWFRDGGAAMYPVLLTGGMALAVAVGHAARSGAGLRTSARSLQLATVSMGLAGSLLGVSGSLRGACACDPSLFGAVAARSVGEALIPVAFALVLVGLGSLFVATGDLRERP